MKKWWIGAVLAAMWVGQSAWGQSPPPGGLLPDPVPVAPCPPQGGPFMPGPLTGAAAPAGPGDALSLPANVHTAWGQPGTPESGAYLSVGSMALMRQRPGGQSIATDALPNGPLINNSRANSPITVALQVSEQLPTGKEVLNTHDIDATFSWGARVTLGYMYDDAAIEVTGFYLPAHDTSVGVSIPGSLALPFFDAPNRPNGPLAFVGPSGIGLWTPADRATISLQTQLGDAELNYRWWSKIFGGIEGIFGFRYFELDERALITADDSLTGIAVFNPLTGTLFNPASRNAMNPVTGAIITNALPPSLLTATYLARASNHILMPQAGFEWNQPLGSWLTLGVTGKAGFGADELDVTTRLSSGTGFVGAQSRSSGWSYTSLYELDAYVDILALERVKVRIGYTAMWLLHVGEAFQQVNYDLSAPAMHRDSGSVFFHGPMIEAQFLF
jgi:hypothetical protein